jgi:hypothetical protein
MNNLRYPLPLTRSRSLSYPLSDREFNLLYILNPRVGGPPFGDSRERGRGVAVPQIFHYGHNRKAVCGACYATKYDSLERLGILAEGQCHDCESPAELLIQF